MDVILTKMASMTHETEEFQNKKSKEIDILKGESYEWTIKDVAKTILINDKWKFESEVFKVKGYDYDIRAKMEKTREKIAFRVQFKDGDTVNEHLYESGFTTMKFSTRDQENNVDTSFTWEADLMFSECYGHPSWIFGRNPLYGILLPPFLKNDCIKIAMSFEPPSIDDRSFASNNGVLMWTVDNYKEQSKQHEISVGRLWSPSFYTSPKGYRVKARFMIKHAQSMLVNVLFLTGEHDKSLSIDFPHKTTVTLINQDDPSKNLVKSERRKDVSSSAIQFGSIKLLEENCLIKDDSLILKVEIKPEARNQFNVLQTHW